MKHLEKHSPILEVLQKASPKLRKAILEQCDSQVICVLSEIILNLLNGHINLSSKQKQKLKKYKNKFRELASQCNQSKRINKKTARKLLIQTGGAFPLLLGLLGPIIAKAALGGAVAAGTGIATKKILGE